MQDEGIAQRATGSFAGKFRKGDPGTVIQLAPVRAPQGVSVICVLLPNYRGWLVASACRMQTGKRISAASGKSPGHVPAIAFALRQALTRTTETGAGVSDLKFSFAQWPMRRIVIGDVIASLFVVLVIAASLPFAVSSGLVRDRLERDIGAWAGHTVSLGDAPSLDFWPTPTITLDKVVIHPSTFSGGDPILRADRIVANFNLFSAVLGAPSFSEFRLIRPTFNVELYPDATSNWSSASGELSQRHSEAAAMARYQAEQAGRGYARRSDYPRFCGAGHGHDRRWHREMDSRPGCCGGKAHRYKRNSLSWTAPTAHRRAPTSHAIFRGEQVTLSGSTSAPLLLLGESRTAPVEAQDLASAPLNIRFWRFGEPRRRIYFAVRRTLQLASPFRCAGRWNGRAPTSGRAKRWGRWN
jgi:AsmA protein